MPTAHFSIVAPRLPLTSELPQIKMEIRKARTSPKQLDVDQDVLSFFSERLEGNWGSLYANLPAFFSDLVAGHWEGTETQSVPSSLLGDFGELVGCSIFRSTCPGTTRVARVLRPSGFKRPDFLVLDTSSKQLTALECKAHAENAARLRMKAIRGHLDLNLCIHMRERRDEGLEQISSKVVIRQRAVAGRPLVERAVANLGAARIIANQSAIVTPLFLDGRVGPLLLNGSISKPVGCGFSCITCLSSAGMGPLILSPIFVNNRESIEPLSPLGMDVERFHSAYRQAGAALWTRSPPLFLAAWRELVAHVYRADAFFTGPGRYMLPLLDVLASALEFDLVADPRGALSDLQSLLYFDPRVSAETIGGLDDALAFHEMEDGWHGKVQEELPVAMTPINRNAGRKSADRTPEPRSRPPTTPRVTTSSSGRIDSPQSSSPQSWMERFKGRLRQAPRESVEPIPLAALDVSAAPLNRFLRENGRSERISELVLPDKKRVYVVRPPVGMSGRIELRLAGSNPEDVRRAVTGLFDILQALRPRDRARKVGQQHICVDKVPLESWDTLLLPAEAEGNNELLAVNTGEGSARLLLGSPL